MIHGQGRETMNRCRTTYVIRSVKQLILETSIIVLPVHLFYLHGNSTVRNSYQLL
jgi:hypothetical protein